MKEELKVSSDQLFFLQKLFESYGKVTYTHVQHKNREAKVIYSILMDVADKFTGKLQTLTRKQDIFSAKKKHKLSFKFHELHAIAVLLRGSELNETDPYKKSMSILLLTAIDQKLQ